MYQIILFIQQIFIGLLLMQGTVVEQIEQSR